MRRESIHKYYWFGTCVRYLQDATPGTRIHDPPGGIWTILSNLQRFFEYLDELELHVTARACSDLDAVLRELDQSDPDARLTAEQAAKLSRAMTDARRTLEAELKGFEAYVVAPLRWDAKRLMEDVGSLFAPGVVSALPEIAQYDLAEAGKCLAFYRPTAAAFHLLRGTEAVLRQFYSSNVKRGRVKLMWGPMVAHLRKKRMAKKHSALLDQLDNIRVSFRNPTQHPEATYDIHQAQDLWGICTDAINRMGAALSE